MEVLDWICQIVIPICGLGGSFLSASQLPRTRMYAGALGLMAEPAWIFTSYMHQQWGIIVLAFFYLFTWGRVFILNRRAYLLSITKEQSHAQEITL